MATYLCDTARKAEAAGLTSLWVMDHFFQIPHVGPAEMDMLEAYTTLGFLAGSTRELELGTLVTGVTYRHPALLVKMATTLDVLSGGRAWLGIGAAWFEREHRGLGIPFPNISERFERLEETLEIARQMWSDDDGPFVGRHYQLAETLCRPAPLRSCGLPIMVGGMGERKTLRLVARYAQACNFFEFAGAEALKGKLEALRRHCDEQQRPYEEIKKTVLGQTRLRHRAQGEKLLVKLSQLWALGFDQAIYALQDPNDQITLEILAEHVVPEARSWRPSTGG